MRQLLSKSEIQPLLRVTVGAAGPGSFEGRLGRENATDKEGEVFTDTSIHVLLLCNFLPSSEKHFLEVNDSVSNFMHWRSNQAAS